MKNETEMLGILIRDRDLFIDACLRALPVLRHTCGERLDTMATCAKCQMLEAVSRCVPLCNDCDGVGYLSKGVWNLCPVCEGAGYAKRKYTKEKLSVDGEFYQSNHGDARGKMS